MPVQSHLFSLAGLIGLFNNTIGMRALVAGLGETNMMRFGILVYAMEMVRPICFLSSCIKLCWIEMTSKQSLREKNPWLAWGTPT